MNAQPLLQLHRPVFRDGKAYGALTFNVHGRQVDVIARADQDLIQRLYQLVTSYVQLGGADAAKLLTGVQMSGAADASCAQLAQLARESPFGCDLTRLADSLPTRQNFESERDQILAQIATAAGLNDSDEAWCAIYNLAQDAADGDAVSEEWMMALRQMVAQCCRQGVTLSGAPSGGPLLAATLLSRLPS